MNSKKIISKKIISAIVIAAISPAAFALKICGICLDCPYLGFELIQTNLNYKEGYGKNLFYKNPVDWNFFGGLTLMRNFGLEAGYEAMPKKGTVERVDAGGRIVGNVVLQPGEMDISEYSIRMSHPYAGLFAQCGWRCLSFQALLGASATHVKARYATLATEFGNATQAEYDSSVRNFSKTKLVPMLKLGAMYRFSTGFAARLSVLYRNTGSIKIKPTPAGGASELKLRDTVGIGIGFMYYFN